MAAATKVAAKVPINTLMAAWQEQAVPVRGTPGHWQGVGGSLEVSHGPPRNRPGEVGDLCGSWELGWEGGGGGARRPAEIGAFGARITSWQRLEGGPRGRLLTLPE